MITIRWPGTPFTDAVTRLGERAASPTATRTGRFITYQALLVALDGVLIVIALVTALAARLALPLFEDAPMTGELVAPLTLPIGLAWLASLALWGAYRTHRLGTGTSEYSAVTLASLSVAASLGITAYLFQYPLSRGFFAILFLLGPTLLIVGRFAARRFVHWLHEKEVFTTPVLLAGDPQHMEDVAAVLGRERWLGYRVVGVLIDDAVSARRPNDGTPVLGRPRDALTAVNGTGARAVIFTEGSFSSARDFSQLARQFEDQHAELLVVPSLSNISAERLAVYPVGGTPLVRVGRPRSQQARRWAKRAFDIIGSSLSIVAFSPVMLATAIAIKLEDGGPVLFRQERVGLKGEVFDCLKFRSMFIDAEARQAALLEHNEGHGVLFKIADDPRVTRVGRFIRRFSIDELPQIFNVWRGQMSLVGPRPALSTEVAKYEQQVRRRLDVRPGITGLWQVSGRSDLSWEDTVRLDLYYVDNWSMVQDLNIALRTVGAVLRARGAY